MFDRKKNILYKMLSFLCVSALFRLSQRGKITIFMYHGICEKEQVPFCWWQLPVDKFRKQLDYVAKHYRVVSLEEAMQRLRAKDQRQETIEHRLLTKRSLVSGLKSLVCRGKPLAVLTFDDGYRNNRTVAYPELKKRNMPATIFLVTDYVGKRELLWYDRLYLAFKHMDKGELDLQQYGGMKYVWDKERPLDDVAHEVGNWVKQFNKEKKDEIVDSVIRQLGVDDSRSAVHNSGEFEMLNWDEIRILHDEGLVTFGAHTCSHEILSRLSRERKQGQIEGSCRAITDKLAVERVPFAYPNGRNSDFDEESIIILKSIDVMCALTTESGLNEYPADLYRLKRIGIGADMTISRFELLSSGFLEYIERFARRN